MATEAGQKGFLGHPRGLAWLAFTEVWERFSYYGMTALVVLYMNQALLIPGRIEHVAAVAGGGAILVLLFGRKLTRALEPRAE